MCRCWFLPMIPMRMHWLFSSLALAGVYFAYCDFLLKELLKGFGLFNFDCQLTIYVAVNSHLHVQAHNMRLYASRDRSYLLLLVPNSFFGIGAWRRTTDPQKRSNYPQYSRFRSIGPPVDRVSRLIGPNCEERNPTKENTLHYIRIIAPLFRLIGPQL